MAPLPEAANTAQSPGAQQYPDAHSIEQKDQGTHANIQAGSEKRSPAEGGGGAGYYVLDGDVQIDYEDRSLKADHVEFDESTGDATLTGHVLVTDGRNDEIIHASHGTLNIKTDTGRFYDVTGSVGMRLGSSPKPGAQPGSPTSQRLVYSNNNPFLFTGREVVKTAPQHYTVYDGTVTSCQLPRPDWLLYAAKFNLDGEKASATKSVFHLVNIPLLWLPYATHPIDANDRQSGVLLPVIGFGSASKGTTIGEQAYWVINRSTDLTLGTVYYSVRGWSENGSFRYRGAGENVARARFSALQDRGYTPLGGAYINQSGVEATFSGRRDLGVATRGVADIDYLSSFLYREGFTDSFNLAVSSDILSTVYGTHAWDGMAASFEADRYQGEKRVQSTTPSGAVTPEEEVHIFHAPAVDFTTTDHLLGSTRLEWNLDSSVAGLNRSEPSFKTSGIIERLDVHPELAYPLHFDGWSVRPSVAVRETFYSRSRLAAALGVTGPPVESTAPVNRTDAEVQLDIRPPVLERTFDSGFVKKLLKHDVKHTIEPEVTYRYFSGITNFADILRFDMADVASNTNELQYGVTQRLFLRRNGDQPCHAAGKGANVNEVLGPTYGEVVQSGEVGDLAGKDESAAPVCGNREWITWRVAQKYFFDPGFGGAVAPGPRSVLDTTLDFSGISFLTGPRNLSPILSRLHVRTTEKTDFEWDFDYDPVASKFTANNVYVDVHQGNLFAGTSIARLNAPARSYVEGVLSSVANFTQMRILFGFGKPTNAGFSTAASAGIDLDLGSVQYGAIQSSYNWNCCGLSVEYRKYELGTARNENSYRFNFTLANIGTAGNLRRTQQVF